MEIGELVMVMFDFSGGGGRLVFRSLLPGILVMRAISIAESTVKTYTDRPYLIDPCLQAV